MDTCLDEKEKRSTLKTWKTLVPGKKREITPNISGHANVILCNAGEQILLQDLKLARKTFGELGFGNGAKLSEAYKVALISGLKLFPNNAVIDFRNQYSEQRIGEKIYLAIEPIKNAKGVLSILVFENNRIGNKAFSEFCIKGFPSNPIGVFGPGEELVFAL